MSTCDQHASPGAAPRYRQVICDKKTAAITCDDDTQKPKVVSAEWGRSSKGVCTAKNGNLKLDNVKCKKDVLSQVAGSCAAQVANNDAGPLCNIFADTRLYGDPCQGGFDGV